MHLNISKRQKFKTCFKLNQPLLSVIAAKSSKPDNVPFNVVTIVITCSQVPYEHVLKKCELVKAKMTVDWQIEKQMCDFFCPYY